MMRSFAKRQSVPLATVTNLLSCMLGTCSLQGMGEASAAELQAAASALGLLPAENAADVAGGVLAAAVQVPAPLPAFCSWLSIDRLHSMLLLAHTIPLHRETTYSWMSSGHKANKPIP